MQSLASDSDSLHRQGIALYRAGRLDEALSCYNRAIEANPGLASAYNSRGFLLQDLGRLQDALYDFQQAVALAPTLAMARLNLGMLQLKLGQFAEGWKNYEARWSGAAEVGKGMLDVPSLPLPMWQGQGDTEHKRLLVVTEQGYGDTFQFVRYLPLLVDRFAGVTFACSTPTQRLIEWSFGDQIATVTRLPTSMEGWSQWDLCCPLMSLPGVCGTTLERIPAQTPYLKVPTPKASHWASRVESRARGSMKVGIAWTGRKEHQADAQRSLSIEQLIALLRLPGITWFNLQKPQPAEAPVSAPWGATWVDWMHGEAEDFAETAALVSHLDLVITVDSAMVHLAGALGKPVWMLDRFNNEWRWLTQREDSPWYPSLRIFRQPRPGAWDEVLERVATALKSELDRSPRPIGGALLQGPAQQQSQQAELLHRRGLHHYQAGQIDLAIAALRDAVRAADNPVYRSNLAEMCRQRGLVNEAIEHGKVAVELEPAMASAWANLGIAYHDAGLQDDAIRCHEQALRLNPSFIPSLNNLGSIARAHKNLPEAISRYRHVLALEPDYVESLSNLGAVLVESDQLDEAGEVLKRALQLRPEHPDALCNMGLLLIKQNETDRAVALLQRSLVLKPQHPEAMVGMALALHEKARLAEAAQVLKAVVQRCPSKADVWCHLGTTLQELGDAQEAQAAFQQALSVDGTMADALSGLGNLRMEQGQLDEAESLLRQAIARDPEHLGARFHLTQLRKVKPDDENLRALETRVESAASLPTDKRISLHYALGKAYDDIGKWDRAFENFLEGARLKWAKFDYDPEAEARRFEQIAKRIDAPFVKRWWGQGFESNVPVFVLGMPRSGTTLTEQILASHPKVHGAGELHELLQIVQGLGAGTSSTTANVEAYPDSLASLTAERLVSWGKQYVDSVRKRAPDALRVTDKMPANYMALGLIPLMLPGAKIIHVRRNPLDTCISCFTRLFNRHQEATYDLYELGRHYARYAELMAHWRRVLPPESFLEVQYEDIVDDMETQARRLIDYVELPWDDACLSFHKTQRSVRTASVAQVRQPIYKGSVERWRHYERYLGPLFDGLGAHAPR